MYSTATTTSTSTPAKPTMELPSFILLEVFSHLPGRDLVVASHVCSLWNNLITGRRRLRANTFVPSEYNPNFDAEYTELHPVISQLHFDDSVRAKEATYGVRKCRAISHDGVYQQLATCPAVKELRLAVLKWQPDVVIRNENGVRVKDVVEELARYKDTPVMNSFEDFFGKDRCSRMGFEKRKQMKRADMVSSEKVLVTFSNKVEKIEDGVLFKAENFRSQQPSKKSQKPEGYKFWGAFLLEA